MAVIVGMDDDAHRVDRPMGTESCDAVPQYRDAAERQVLFRQRCAEPGTAPGGDHEGNTGAHRQELMGQAKPAASRLPSARPIPQNAARALFVASQQKDDRIAMKS